MIAPFFPTAGEHLPLRKRAFVGATEDTGFLLVYRRARNLEWRGRLADHLDGYGKARAAVFAERADEREATGKRSLDP